MRAGAAPGAKTGAEAKAQAKGGAGAKALVARLRGLARPGAVEGMARYGIRSKAVIGVAIPDLRRIAKEVGTDHALSLALWETGIHDARTLATLVADPLVLTPRQRDAWVRELDNWAIVDALCLNLLRRVPGSERLVPRLARRRGEWARRAAFSLLAVLAVHARSLPDEALAGLLPLAEKAALDERNGVKKGVSWALRQVGKRSLPLRSEAIGIARRIRALGTPAARWIASDVLRELD